MPRITYITKIAPRQKQRQRLKQLAENQRLSLKRCLYSRILLMHLRKGLFDKFRGIANGDAGQQIEIDRYAGELIEMIHSLRTNHFLHGRDRA